LDEFRPNPDARPNLLNALGAPDDAVLIGLVARYDPLKDHSGFLKAAGQLNRAYPKVRFVLAGYEVTQENAVLDKEIIRHGLEGRVHLLGERRDVPDIMAGLDFLVSSSISEGFPNVIGEAMACGVPCVVTDAGDSAFLVGDTGRVVRPKDPEALTSGMQELIELGSEQRRRLGMVARERVNNTFSLYAAVSEYEGVYKNLVGDKAIFASVPG
jgi:glycosyltransferase involved in cell wall biosynthesis